MQGCALEVLTLDEDKKQRGLTQAANTAHAIHGAIKVGKSISAAAKGAAAGGPYGAVAGALWGAKNHVGKILAAMAVLILLPVLFVLMLPSLIFGGLTSSGSQPNQPILNDNASIIQNTNDIAFSVSQILGEGITDAETRISQDFADTDGDQYEIINPYAADMAGNSNVFIAQYCAAKEQDWATISLSDLERLLRQGKSHLYSFTRISEIREVEDDDPETEDVVETKQETWYIYTLVYNGETYFADTVFHLTDDQKELAGDYAQNLSLFLGDGMFQYADAVNGIPALGDIRFTDGATEVVYFNQLDERYANEPYGTDNIGGYACGPTSMSIVVSSLTSETVDPVEMSKWAYENGYWCSKSGSYHTLIPGAAKAWGLPVEGCTASDPQRIVDALSEGKLVVALMTKGHFTKSGHFIVLRGIQDGQILVADPASYNRSQKLWDLSIILNEASKRAGAGGPFWIIG